MAKLKALVLVQAQHDENLEALRIEFSDALELKKRSIEDLARQKLAQLIKGLHQSCFRHR